MSEDARVAIVQRSLRRYREPFYERLRHELDGRGIGLELIHTTTAHREKRGDPGTIPWAETAPARFVSVRGNELVWQPLVRRLREVDLVVVEQASVLLLNYALLVGQRVRGPRVAFWGHGANFNTNARSSVGETIKQLVSRQAHWWFPYTDEGAAIVADRGFPRERITVVRNATDTRRLAAQIGSVTDADVRQRLEELDLQGQHVGLFMGSLSPYKQLEFLFQAADHVRAKVHDFELLVVGGGTMGPFVAQEARRRPWVRVLPPHFDGDLAMLLRLAKVMLVPGWAGLVVVDSFAAGVPLVASAGFPHPPEIAYIEHGANGLLVDDGGDPEVYGRSVSALLLDESQRSGLVQGCLAARRHYSVEDMAARFAAGIERALAVPRRRRRPPTRPSP